MTGRFAPFDGARKLDRTAVQQQFFCECRLTGVRMRNDRKGAPFPDLFVNNRHDCSGIGRQFLCQNRCVLASFSRLVIRGSIRNQVETLLLVKCQRVDVRWPYFQENLTY